MITPLPWKGEQNPAYALLSTPHHAKRQGLAPTLAVGPSVPAGVLKDSISQPARQTSRRLIEVSKQQPCNICGRTEGYCKVDTANDQWLCSQTVDSVRVGEVVTGRDCGRWARIGGKSDWALFRLDQPRERTNQTVRSVHCRPKPQHAVIPLLGVSERDEAFGRMLEQLTLEPEHHADLIQRGFTDEQITAAGFRTIKAGFTLNNCPDHLPGFRNGQFAGQSGFLLPIRTIDGMVVGFQTRSANGYRWASIEGNYRLPIDEPPLVFLPGTTKEIFLAEGTGAKPAFINQTTGSMVVGASGARWNGSPKQIAELVAAHPDATFTLLPDAGSTLNPRITDNYRQTAELFSRLGVELGFQWWDQLEKGTDPDADETAFWANGIRLLSTEFFSDEFRQQCEEKISTRNQVSPASPNESSESESFIPKDAVDTTKPTLLIQAPMGSGKTELIKQTIHADETRTLCATHRRNLSRNGAARVAKQPYVEEGDTFDPISGEKALGLDVAVGDWSCIDSWHARSALKRTPSEISNSRVVYDEIDQLLQHVLTSTTCIGERSDILATLHQGLPQTAQLIGASATLDDITVEWVEAVTQRPVHVHRHISNAPRWKHSFLDSQAHAIGQIIKAVSCGENVLIATSDTGDDEKGSDIGAHNLIGTLRQHCAGLDETNTAAFTSASIAAGEQGSRQKLFMRDPVSAVRELRVAIYSPVAETGVDINLKGHFDKVFVLSSGRTMTAQAVVQAAARLRDPDAQRFFWVPKSSPVQEGHGITDWKELVAVTLKQTAEQTLMGVLRSNSLRNNVAPHNCPHLRAWAKFQIRSELTAKHYRFVIEALLKEFGSERNAASVVTQSDKVAAKQVKEFTKQKRAEADLAVITAPTPDRSDFELATREQKVAGRRRQKIETRSGKTLSPENTSEVEVRQLEKAFTPLKFRHLLSHPHLAKTIDHEAAKRMSGFEGDTRKLHTKNKVDHLLAMGADRILQTGVVLNGNSPEALHINQYLHEHGRELTLLFGKKARAYNQPMRAVSWLASLVGLKTAELGEVRRNGRLVTEYRLIEAFDAVDVEQILGHWTSRPEVITGVKPRIQEPSPQLNSVGELVNKEETEASFPTARAADLPDWCMDVPSGWDIIR